MEKNYFIKNGYIPNKITENVNIQEWEGLCLSQKTYYYQYYTYLICRNLTKKFKLKSVLDVGCRDANKLMKLIYPICNDVYGIDKEKYFIDLCKKKYKNHNFFVDDVENPKLKINKKFELIICSDIIEHLANPDNLLDYVKKYSNNNSVVVFSTPERDLRYGESCNKPKLEGHIREWNSTEFKNYLEYMGFKIIYQKFIYNSKIRL
ncbi:unnamed protein product, partial [marine sediment metagenome]